MILSSILPLSVTRKYLVFRMAAGSLAIVGWGTDWRSLVTLTRYKAANIENEYSGAELAV